MKEKKELIKFAKNSLVFVLIVLVLTLAINFYYTQNIQKNKVIFKQEISYETSNNFKILFLGDSHIMENLDPAQINNSYNMGATGENYIESYYRLIRVLEIGKKNISILIINLDPHSFSSSKVEKEIIKQPVIFSKFMSFSQISLLNSKSIQNTFMDCYFPFFGKGWEIMQYLNRGGEGSQIDRGFVRLRAPYNVSLKSDSQIKYNVYFNNKKQVDELSLDYFSKLITLSKKHNLKIVIITMPHSKDYADLLKSKNVKVDNFATEIIESINDSNQIKYLNYYSLYFNNSNYFEDSDHLNVMGAQVFSKQVDLDLEKI